MQRRKPDVSLLNRLLWKRNYHRRLLPTFFNSVEENSLEILWYRCQNKKHDLVRNKRITLGLRNCTV